MSTLLAACPGPVVTDTDAPPVDDDAPPGANGLALEFKAPQELPHTLGMTTLKEVRIWGKSVRVNGDSGDDETTERDFDLRWSSEKKPRVIMFDEAPSGLYSSVEIQIQEQSSSGQPAIEIKGEAVKGGMTYPFEIESDDSIVAINIGINTMLQPGQTAKIEIVVDLAALIAGIDWENVDLDDGELSIGDGDTAQIAALQTRLRNAFTPFE